MTLPGEAVLAQAADRFGIEHDTLAFLRDSANVIYTFRREEQDYILRLTPGAGRDEQAIYGEMEWIEYLDAHHGHVATPVRSLRGRLVEPVGEAETLFFAVVTHKVPGVHPEGALLNDDVLFKIGQALGRMHHLSQDYVPSSPEIRRLEWHDLDVFQLQTRLPASQPQVMETCRRTLAALHRLPRPRNAYGLIHADPEPWNFLLHEGELTFIDFDDCCYHWFAFDLAVALFYAVLAAGEEAGEGFAQHAWNCLYAGYNREHPLSPFWIERLDLFMRLRVLEDYAFHLSIWDLDHLQEWQKQVLHSQRHALENNGPILNVIYR